MTRSARFFQLLLITVAIFVVDIAIEIYVPALPSLLRFFDTTDHIIKLTVSYNIIGLAISGLFYGGLSDCYGRKPVLVWGMFIFFISSFLCIFAPNVYVFIIFRFIQGVGQGCAIIVGFASVRDVYSGEKCAQIVSRLSMIVGVSPAIAPILGSFILTYYSWKFIFISLAFLGFCAVIALLFFFKETLQRKRTKEKIKFDIWSLACGYLPLFRNGLYISYCAIVILNFVWLWNVIASVPFLLLEDMGVSMQYYGYLIALNVSGFILGTILNQRYVVRVGIRKMINIGLFFPVATDTLVILIHYTIGIDPLLLQCIWFFSALGLSFVIGNATTAALDQVGSHQSSKAMAILVFSEMVLSAISIYINCLFYSGTVVSISVFTVCCTLLSIAVFYAQSRYIKNSSQVSKLKQTP